MPPDYMFFQWRKEMGGSYLDMLATPYEVILRDLSYISMNNEMQNMKAKKAANNDTI